MRSEPRRDPSPTLLRRFLCGANSTMAFTETEISSATVSRTQQPKWAYPKRVSMTTCSNCVLARSTDLTFKSTAMIRLAFSVAT